MPEVGLARDVVEAELVRELLGQGGISPHTVVDEEVVLLGTGRGLFAGHDDDDAALTF